MRNSSVRFTVPRERLQLEAGNTEFSIKKYRSARIKKEKHSPFLMLTYIIARIAAGLSLLLLFPLLCMFVLLIRCTSPGPAIYRQVRVGRRGKEFVLYKLRTMNCDAEEISGPVWSWPGDPRITRVGRFLRRWHLDELPQLYNVLRGEMAWVGPRPERPEIVDVLARSLNCYLHRHLVTPGLTGMAQVQLPPDADIESVRRKLQVDLVYIRHVTPWLDIRLLWCTCLRWTGVTARSALVLAGLAKFHWRRIPSVTCGDGSSDVVMGVTHRQKQDATSSSQSLVNEILAAK